MRESAMRTREIHEDEASFFITITRTNDLLAVKNSNVFCEKKKCEKRKNVKVREAD